MGVLLCAAGDKVEGAETHVSWDPGRPGSLICLPCGEIAEQR